MCACMWQRTVKERGAAKEEVKWTSVCAALKKGWGNTETMINTVWSFMNKRAVKLTSKKTWRSEHMSLQSKCTIFHCSRLHFLLWWLSICVCLVFFGLPSEISWRQTPFWYLKSKVLQTARERNKDSKLQTQPDVSSLSRRRWQVLWWCVARNFTQSRIKSATERRGWWWWGGIGDTCAVCLPACLAMSQGAIVSLNKNTLENEGGCLGSRCAARGNL